MSALDDLRMLTVEEVAEVLGVHGETVRRWVRDDCQAAGVPFFFKGWGEWRPAGSIRAPGNPRAALVCERTGEVTPWNTNRDAAGWHQDCRDSTHALMFRVGRRRAGRVLDGRTHDELPWLAEVALK